MIYKRQNGAEFAPCIISQVKYKLHLKTTIPTNSKKCSDTYWNEAIRAVARVNGKTIEEYRHLLR